jgi:hypothetical protein
MVASAALLGAFAWGQIRGRSLARVSPLGGTPLAPSAPENVPAAAAPVAAAPSLPVEHVLLLTIDSLRGDQPWTGYEAARTPNLSALAARSVVYERAYAAANVTGPSLAALLSGRFPSELGRTRCAVPGYRLGHGLAPFLKASGVATSAAHGGAQFASYAAPSDGFDEWRQVEGAAALGPKRDAVTGAALAALLEGTLAAPPSAAHLFLWAHFVDPRYAYVPHPDFPPSGHPTRGAYDGEVAYTDAMVGRVLDALEHSPLAGRTAVIVAGNHGEAFGEHGYYRHGRSAFEEELRVPLLVYVPGVVPARIEAPRSTIDVAPTVAALFGLKPPPAWRGRSLLDDLGPEGAATRPVFFDSPEWKGRPLQRGVIVGNTKVVLEKGHTRVYDLSADAEERAPVGDRRTVAAVKLARGLLSRLAFIPASPCPIDRAERLGAAGDAGGGPRTASADGSAAPLGDFSELPGGALRLTRPGAGRRRGRAAPP